jgi:hypothetical protein
MSEPSQPNQWSTSGAPPPPPAYNPAPVVPYGVPGGTPYPQSPYGYAQAPSNDGMAIAALVCSLTGFFTCGVTSILAVIFGFVSRAKIKKSNGGLIGSGMALAGIIVGFVGIALFLLYFVVVIGIARRNGNY